MTVCWEEAMDADVQVEGKLIEEHASRAVFRTDTLDDGVPAYRYLGAIRSVSDGEVTYTPDPAHCFIKLRDAVIWVRSS